MEFVEKLIKHPIYIDNLQEIERLEKVRIFCCHGFSHFMDVARIAYIYSLEEGFNIEKELIYITALLHDIGRAKEYKDGIPHEQASRNIAELILEDIHFPEEKVNTILTAIENHRNKEIEKKFEEKSPSEKLKFIINMADKKSRNCFFCGAYEQCNWGEDKKNKVVTF